MPAPQIPIVKLAQQGIGAALETIQVNVNKALAQLVPGSALALLQGKLISVADGTFNPKAQLLITGPLSLTIKHGLGRAYTGWLVVRRSNGAAIFEGPGNTAPESQLVLVAPSSVLFTLWVF